jgi:Ca2+-binding RTX toxin-like protein
VTGTYGGTPGPADSVNVFFYNDASTLPGALVAEYDGVAPSAGLATASFVLPLSPPVSLTDGTYWVSVQTNQNSFTNGQWLWEIRSVQSGNGAAWQNPGGGFGTGCTSWGRESTCIPGTGPDQMFSLSGTAATCTISGDGVITGTAGPDVICGGPGNDTINSLGGGDTIYGLAGNDALLGKAGPDTLMGGPGSDFLKGGYGNDHLDAVDGVSGNDNGTGGRGFDTCTKDAGDTLSSCEA